MGYDYCTRPWIATMVNNKELLWAVFAPKLLYPYTPLSHLSAMLTAACKLVMEREAALLNTLRARCPIYYLHLFIIVALNPILLFLAHFCIVSHLKRIRRLSRRRVRSLWLCERCTFCRISTRRTFSSRCKMVCDRRRSSSSSNSRRPRCHEWAMHISCLYHILVDFVLKPNWRLRRAGAKKLRRLSPSDSCGFHTGSRECCWYYMEATHWCNKAGFWFNSFWPTSKKFHMHILVTVYWGLCWSNWIRFGFECVFELLCVLCVVFFSLFRKLTCPQKTAVIQG